MDQGWIKDGSGMDQGWIRDGSGMDQGWMGGVITAPITNDRQYSII